MIASSHRSRHAFWLKHLHRWHWISAATCLVGMLLFAITGITLNNAGHIEARPQVREATANLPDTLLPLLRAEPASDKAPLPPAVALWIADAFGADATDRATEWSKDEVYVSLPRPGGDAWLSIQRADGEAIYEITDRGWVSYLNDLHKGRNTGKAWSWFLDIFAIACLVFAVTGLVLLHLHARHRAATWPLVGFGLVAPLLLVLLFIH